MSVKIIRTLGDFVVIIIRANVISILSITVIVKIMIRFDFYYIMNFKFWINLFS